MTSTNVLTGKAYSLPKQLSDKQKIDSFLAKNNNSNVVVVQGLGFVGSVMSLVVANAKKDYAVIGVDLPNENGFWKICSINEGVFPVVAADPQIDEFYSHAMERGNLFATFDPYAYSKADVIIIDINLDVAKQNSGKKELQDYDVNLEPFKKSIYAIGRRCKENALILVETTVPPGTCKNIVAPILYECLEERGLSAQNIKIAHSYERVMPGPNYVNSIRNFYRVYSGIDEKSAQAAESFLRTIISTDEYPLTRLGNTNATEMAKVLENSYRAMNIAFMVEWSRFAEEAGVNLYEVVDAIRMRPTHKNIMLPGLGVGGYCLPKDPLLASWSKKTIFKSEEPLQQSEASVNINDQMPVYAFNFLKRQYKQSLNGKKVLLLGVSYLNDVGDTRYTPVEAFYDELLNAGCKITVHDPHIVYWEEKNLIVDKDLLKLVNEDFDIIVITAGHRDYKNNPFLLEMIMNKNTPQFIYDTIGVLNSVQIDQLTTKHTVKIIGRGDL